MRPKYLPYIVIGIVLIYISLYGLEGFGLSLVGDRLKEDFDTLQRWTVYGTTATINPAGNLELTTSNRVDVELLSPTSWGNQFTCEARVKIDQWGSNVEKDNIALIHCNGLNIYIFAIYQNKVMLSLNTFPVSNDNQWHIWTWTVDRTSGEAKIYRDGTLLGTGTVFSSADVTQTYLLLTSGLAHVDYWYADTGVKPPSPTSTYSDVTILVSGQGTTVPAAGHYTTTYRVGDSLTITATPASGWAFDYMTRNGVIAPSMTLTSLAATENIVVYFKTGSATTGTLRVFASYNGAYVVASIIATGPQTVFGSTTTSSTNPLAFIVTAGTYTVSGSYSSGSVAPQTVTVPAGGSVDVNLDFGGSPPPNGTLDQILAKIKEIFRTPSVKQLLLVIGMGMAGIGGLMFILPEKHATAPPPPRYY
jgi:hypothetical protein